MTPSLDYLGHIRPLTPSRHSPLFLLFPSNSLSSPPNYPTNVQLSVRRSSSSRSRSSATLMRDHDATRQSTKEKSDEKDRRRLYVVFPCRSIVVLNSPWDSRSPYRRCIPPLDEPELPRCLSMRDTHRLRSILEKRFTRNEWEGAGKRKLSTRCCGRNFVGVPERAGTERLVERFDN